MGSIHCSTDGRNVWTAGRLLIYKPYLFTLHEYVDQWRWLLVVSNQCKVMLSPLVEGDPKAPFSIATSPKCRGRHNSFPWIAPLYPKYVAQSSWIHQLYLCRGGKNPHNKCLWYDTKQIWWWGSSNAGALGNVEYPFIVIAPRHTMARCGSYLWIK